MKDERWQLAYAIYETAARLPEPARRQYVHEAAPDEEIAARVLAMLAEAENGAEPEALPERASSKGAGAAPPSRNVIGQRLSHFTITARLGAGGMGEVYRATDTTLGRDVAIKVLPRDVAGNADRLARFRREAYVLAALNHPNIAAIYGFEEANDTAFLVLELVEGEDLAERLRRGPIPMREALEIAKQIAEALEAAHERGIIHRDLKPANVKVTPSGTTKVLDFGLAKAYGSDVGTGVASKGPSLSAAPALRDTAPGVIVGTLAYMSPEQMQGRSVDRRSDVWAFGVVLFELLTGRALIGGETITDLIAAGVTGGLDWSRLPADTPPAIRRLLRRCLQRDPRLRLPDIGAARLEISEVLAGVPEEETAATSTPPASRGRSGRRARLAAWVAGAVLLGAAGGAFFVMRQQRTQPAERPLQRLMLQTPHDLSLNPFAPPLISPDGQRVVVTGRAPDSRSRMLWIRHLDSLTFQPLAGTEGVEGAFWSPDSRSLGYAADGQIKRVTVDGGVQTLSELDSRYLPGGTWNSQGTIVIAKGPKGQNGPGPSTLVKVSATTGEWEPLTTLDESRGESGHYWPQFLPDGRHIAFQVASTNSQHRGVFITALDSPDDRRPLLAELTMPRFALDHVLFVRGSALLAAPFDSHSLRTTGEPSQIAEGVSFWRDAGLGMFSTSRQGVVVFTPLHAPDMQLAWMGRNGGILTTIGRPHAYDQLALSPDETRAAVELPDEDGRYDIWLLDLARGTSTRLTFDPADDRDPVWSPDGSVLVFSSNRTGPKTLFRRDVTGDDPESPLFETKEDLYPESWTPDGKRILYETGITPRLGQSWNVDQPSAAQPIVKSSFALDELQVSPGGRLLAYTSTDSGQYEVYVQPFERPGQKVRVSTDGGGDPKWRRDGTELFYVAPDGTLMAVQIQEGSQLAVSLPEPLFRLAVEYQPVLDNYAPSRDGQRFLVKLPVDPVANVPIHVVLNWNGIKRSGQ